MLSRCASILVIVLAGSAALVAACTPAGPSPQARADAQTRAQGPVFDNVDGIRFTATESSLTPDSATASAGLVRLIFINRGVQPHSFVLNNPDGSVRAAQLVIAGQTALIETNDLVVGAYQVTLDPGVGAAARATLTIK